MDKLIAKFEATGLLKDAIKLVQYLNRHMMAECMADTYQATWIQVARDMVEQGETR